jgi:hypothetical protein
LNHGESLHDAEVLMTSRICFGTLVFALSSASVSVAVEPSKYSFQPRGDQFAAPIAPGMRFGGAELASVRTAGQEGGYGYGGSYGNGYGALYGGGYGTPFGAGYGAGNGGCNCGGNGGLCADWTLLPWVASWDDHQKGYGKHVRKACSNCNY